METGVTLFLEEKFQRGLIGGQNLKSMEKCHNQKQSETMTRQWDLLINWSKISQHIEFTCNHSITLSLSVNVSSTEQATLSANVANIRRFDHVDHMIVYMNKQQSCKECNKKANPMWEKCDASLSSLHPKCFKAYLQA